MQSSEIKLLESFIKTLQHLSTHTQHAYQRDLKHLQAYCDNHEINEWTSLDGRQLRGFVAARHRQGVNGRSLQRNLSAIRAFYRFLLEQKIAKTNPAEGIIAPKSSKKLPKVLDVDQTKQLVEIKSDDELAIRDSAMFELIYSSGLRLSELISLNLNDIDFGDRILTVTGKGNKTRRIPVGAHAISALNRWLKKRQTPVAPDQQALFISRRGRRISRRSVQQRLKQWALRQGLPNHVHPHMLRHSFASHILESSGDLRAVQELLGHADISTTQVYTHLDFQHLAQVYDKTHPRAHRKKSD